MFRKVVLHGELASRYGESFTFDLENPREAINALFANLKGFKQDFIRGFFHLVIGDPEYGIDLGVDDLGFKLGKQREIHIIPVIEGAKSQRSASTMKILAGVMMLVPFGFAASAAISGAAAAGGAAAGSLAAAGGISGVVATASATAIGGSTLASLGLSMVLTGVSNLLAPSPKVNDYGSREQADQRPSFLFNGPINTSASGQAVPLVYGKFRAGSILISSGMQAEQI